MSGCALLGADLFRKLFSVRNSPVAEQASSRSDILPSSGLAAPSIELFALPGHGKTSFIWATLFMLRQLSRVWPGYLCWPADETTSSSLIDIHRKLQEGWLPEATDSKPLEHRLRLKNLSPWGERTLKIVDDRDPVFTVPEKDETARPTHWNVPLIWLLSLTDFDDVDGRFLDLKLDRLVRARLTAKDTIQALPLRLVVVLTKADALPELPSELRCFLKDDPLCYALNSTAEGMFRANDEIRLPAEADGVNIASDDDPVQLYFQARRLIHRLVVNWMQSNSSGRALLSRAEEFSVELKFSVVSATGSGFATSDRLATSWSPRRVLDPYFWCLEMEGS